ncbi:MAG: iron ABC transporter permease [Candidatus Caldarchaeum sp.]|nr:iron ABC transporter permease [Candidatus Caldarchaeum sp.]
MLFVSFLSSVLVGSVRLPTEHVLMHLFGLNRDSALLGAVVDLRVVRTAAAVLTGVSLGVAGAMLQSLFRNPLADPFILGISSGSSLAIAITLVLGLGLGFVQTYDPYALYTAGALGAAATSLLVVFFSTFAKTSVGLVLAGVMLGYLNAGITTLIITLSEVETVRAFSFWTLGTFSAAKWSVVEPVLPLMLAGLAVAFLLGKPLNGLAFGDEAASSMGVWVRGSRVATVAAASSVVAAATVVAGPIGFIGLAAPHVARLAARTVDNRFIIPLSGLTGGTLAVLADITARSIMPPLDLPSTAITSIFGAPLILVLLLRSGRTV